MVENPKYQRIRLLIGSILAAFCVVYYLGLFFRQGIWYHDMFLYQTQKGVFENHSFGDEIILEIQTEDKDSELISDVTITVDMVTQQYKVILKERGSYTLVEVYENGNLSIEGKAIGTRGDYFLLDSNNQIIDKPLVIVSDGEYIREDLFPNYTGIVNLASKPKLDFRGSLAMLALVVLLSIILAVDCKFPNLAYNLHNGLWTEGGEPSDFYRITQKVSRVLLVIGIVVCAILSLLYPYL